MLSSGIRWRKPPEALQRSFCATFSPIAPLSFQRRLSDFNVFGHYHLLLAHMVLQNTDEYGDYYADYEEQYGCAPLVIVDNSLIELGQPLQPSQIVKAAELVGASFLVLPDKLGDTEVTIEMSMKAAYELRGNLPEGCSLMGVVQGQNIRDVRRCATVLKEECGCTWLSVPRIMYKYFGSRRYVTEAVWKESGLPIHLLGFSDDIRDDIDTARYGREHADIRGIDAAVPVWYGQQGGLFPFDSSKVHIEGGRPKDFWDWKVDCLKPEVLVNIQRTMTWVRGW